MGWIARLLKIENNDDKEIVQTVERHYKENKYCDQYAMSGDDSPPLENDRVVLADIEGVGHSVSLGVLAHSQGAEQGERILYSRESDSDEKKLVAKMHLKKDGGIEICSLDKDDNFKEVAKMTFSKDGKIQLSSIKSGQVKADVVLDSEGNLTVTGKKDTKITVDGKIELNGNSKQFVTWAELNQTLQQIWTSVKTHTHIVATTGTAAAQSGTAAASVDLASVVLDLTSSKTQTVLTGG